MPLIREHADYITMINYFRVNPRDQAALMKVQEEDLALFGRRQPAMRAASFHQSTDGDRVINYAHWADMEGLAAWRHSADFRAHMDRMAPFEFKVDPHPYQIVRISSVEAPPRIAPRNQLYPSLIMAETDPASQGALVEALGAEIGGWRVGLPSGHTASWIAKSLDGVRVALYSQWPSREARRAFVGDGGGALGSVLAVQGVSYELKEFDVGTVGYKFDPDGPAAVQ